MGKSAAERKLNQMLKLKKDGKYEEFKKQSEKQKQQRAKKKNEMSIEDKDIHRKKHREEQRRHRQSKRNKEENVTPSSSRYKSRCTFGKAVTKAKRGLPNSPAKRKILVTKLTLLFSPDIVSPCSVEKEKNRRSIRDEVKNSIVEFYTSDGVSYQAPHTRDFVTICRENKKHKVQKRYLYCILEKTFQQYKKRSPEVEIGLTKFSELRPQHVCLRAETPANLCLCIYHENIKLLLTSLTNLPNSTSEFIQSVVCDANNENYMLSNCDNCSNGKKFHEYLELLFPEVDDTEVTYQQWMKDEVRKVCQKKISSSLDEFFCTLEAKLPLFLNQASYFDELKQNLSMDSIVMQVDCNVNYCFHYQDEIQSAHWKSESCTLYTAIVYFKGEDMQTLFESYVLISDYMHHAVVHFNSAILFVVFRFIWPLPSVSLNE